MLQQYYDIKIINILFFKLVDNHYSLKIKVGSSSALELFSSVGNKASLSSIK